MNGHTDLNFSFNSGCLQNHIITPYCTKSKTLIETHTNKAREDKKRDPPPHSQQKKTWLYSQNIFELDLTKEPQGILCNGRHYKKAKTTLLV